MPSAMRAMASQRAVRVRGLIVVIGLCVSAVAEGKNEGQEQLQRPMRVFFASLRMTTLKNNCQDNDKQQISFGNDKQEGQRRL